MFKKTIPFLMASVVATTSIFALAGVAQARGGSDDGPSHDVTDDQGGHGNDDATKTGTPALSNSGHGSSGSNSGKSGQDDTDTNDDNSGHGEKTTPTVAPASTGTPSSGGNDDGPDHDANDDSGGGSNHGAGNSASAKASTSDSGRSGEDDGPLHDLDDDHGVNSSPTASPSSTGTPSTGGNDDGPLHDVNDDNGGRAQTVQSTQLAIRSTRTTLLARLMGIGDFPRANGKAKLVSSSTAFELQIEVEHIARLAGTRVDFFVGDRNVGSQTVSALGAAEIQVNGTGPLDVAGKRVIVKTLAGAIIAAGNFE